MFNRFFFVLPTTCFLLCASCREPQVRSYEIPKEKEPAVAAREASDTASSPPRQSLIWQKPQAWQQQTGKAMRVASFLLGTKDGINTELAITTFPGDVGGDFANVNRWRDQINLPAITEAELPASITSFDLPAGRFQLVDITSTEPLLDGRFKARILGAWSKQGGQTWFFKITGDEETVGRQRDELVAFLGSVRFESATPSMNEPAARPNDAASPASSEAAKPGLEWTVPDAWIAKPLGQMRKGSYSVPAAGAEAADLSITMFPAATNPLLDNINRWRRQLGLGPVGEADLSGHTTTLSTGSLVFTIMEASHEGNGMVGAILYLGDEAWFFKLSGTAAAVAQNRDAFTGFLRTVKTR